jgi:hypothetical protein
MSKRVPDTAAANSALDAAREPYGSTTFQVEAASPSARGTAPPLSRPANVGYNRHTKRS